MIIFDPWINFNFRRNCSAIMNIYSNICFIIFRQMCLTPTSHFECHVASFILCIWLASSISSYLVCYHGYMLILLYQRINFNSAEFFFSCVECSNICLLIFSKMSLNKLHTQLLHWQVSLCNSSDEFEVLKRITWNITW